MFIVDVSLRMWHVYVVDLKTILKKKISNFIMTESKASRFKTSICVCLCLKEFSFLKNGQNDFVIPKECYKNLKENLIHQYKSKSSEEFNSPTED